MTQGALADGVVRQTGDTYEVVFVRRLTHPIDKVWAALTVPERIAAWFTDMVFVPDLRLGARVTIGFGRQIPLTGEVVALEPPRLLAWTWGHDAHPGSFVRCELAPEAGGCVLTFSQSNMRLGKLAEVAAGWHACLEGLGAAASGQAGAAWTPDREASFEPRYEAQVAALPGASESEPGPAAAHANGTIRKTADGYELVFVRRIGKPIQKVWAALTVPERLADWLATATLEPDLRVGARFSLDFGDGRLRATGRIVALEPPHLVAWTWPAAASENGLAPGIVRFQLAADADGCVLTLTSKSAGLPHPNELAGWHTHLEGLEGAAEGVRTSLNLEREAVHERRYAVALATS